MDLSAIVQPIHAKYTTSELSPPQQKVIKEYIDGSAYLNNQLREGFDVNNAAHREADPALARRIFNMDDALRAARQWNAQLADQYPDGVLTLYRGINSPALGQYIESMGHLAHPHYMSTSVNKKVASDMFAGAQCCVFHIVVSRKEMKELSFLYVSGPKGSSEDEVLFERGIYLNLARKEVVQGKTTYIVVPSKTPRILPAESRASSPQHSATPFISAEEVEQEWELLDEADQGNLPSAVRTIAESLKMTYKTVPIEDLERQVAAFLNKSIGGKRQTPPQKKKKGKKVGIKPKRK